MGFFRQEHWSGLPFPPPGELPDPGVEPMSLGSPALGVGCFATSATWEALDDSSGKEFLRSAPVIRLLLRSVNRVE